MLVKGSIWSGWILMILIPLMNRFSNVLSIALRERLLTIASDSRILWISDGQLYNWVAHVLHAAGEHNRKSIWQYNPWTRHLNYLQYIVFRRPELHIIRQPKEIRSPRHLCFGCKEVPDGLQVMELSKRFDGNLVQRTEKYSIAMYKIHSKIIMLTIMIWLLWSFQRGLMAL